MFAIFNYSYKKFELQEIMLSSQSSSSSSVTFLDVLCCDAVPLSSGMSSFKGSRKSEKNRIEYLETIPYQLFVPDHFAF